MAMTPNFEETGLEVIEIDEPALLSSRHVRQRDLARQVDGLQRIAHASVLAPETILQVVAEAAVELCGADSAGISVVKDGATDGHFYEWAAAAGEYTPLLHVDLPRYPSACAIALERGGPQSFRVGAKFFELLGVEGPPVVDGLLFPWEVVGIRGTIFVMSHKRENAFDAEDYRLMRTLADFAAMAVRQERQQKLLVEQAAAAAAAGMASRLAHRINNPLQSLTNQMYMAAEGMSGMDAVALGKMASAELDRLSGTVQQLLGLPYRVH